MDKATDNTVQFCLHQNTLGVSQKLMSATDVAVTLMALMCSPVKDHGPASWHRDIDPVHQAPLNGVQMDMMANVPGYLQWNIPLYDDNVFWVVPGSHCRPNDSGRTSAPADSLPAANFRWHSRRTESRRWGGLHPYYATLG